ncbi:endonuclease YncB(thermonuclease family) [Variovorax sp. 3319]|nr:endonuclease YncB(thermonuclease family) [Variovorax sp. 3319]
MLRPLLLAGLLSLPVLAQAAEPRTCLVVGVSDGDTITARCGAAGDYEQIKVRFNGIDAPERKQPFGQRSKEALSDLVYMKEAQLDCPKVDRYGRSVCKVMVAPASAPAGRKTLDVGLAMVTLGMAWWYRAYSREQTAEERGQYEFAEFEAKAKRVGLWRDEDPMPPWNWRQMGRTERP